MSEKFDKFSNELDVLILDGEQLQNAIQYECHPTEFREALKVIGDKKKQEEFIQKLPNFKAAYQAWFSKSQAVIKQILPDRLTDFNSYYEFPKPRKDISFQNYMIKDALQGLVIRRYGDVIADTASAIPEFNQQINILRAAKNALGSRLMEIRTILQAELFDSEVESARALSKAGYLRGAGAICGVVIEKHLTEVCDAHGLSVKKKNPGISDLNQLLKDNDTITVPQWRFVQHLADIRNLCDHAKEREPTNEEIADLVAGTEKILKTIF
ncbi:hypothetical protein R1521_06235 [Rhizobium brockwellii]|uniref:DUF4145 domain-containing protein n=1 Tax=Rhizobium brockwellii TaxID=3019932 RepID=A0ABU3YH41_9HYPH|nr:hypothetical protein [Rhizobium brockwellii]MDV4178103.1 hypothetical protein [Rhizobium brockwellii]MDV4185102.1 hypothetical protein [Rhizobium brockwellii]